MKQAGKMAARRGQKLRAAFAAALPLAALFSAAAPEPAAARPPQWENSRDYNCSFKSTDNVNFGTVESSSVTSRSVQGRFAISCSSSRRWDSQRDSRRVMYFCLGLSGADAQGWRQLQYFGPNPTGGKDENLPFRLKADAFGGDIIGSMERTRPAAPLFFNKDYVRVTQITFDLPFTAELGASGYNLRPGIYQNGPVVTMQYGLTQDSFSVDSSCKNIGLPKAIDFTTMTITATVKSSCNIKTVNDINFGKFPDLSRVPPQDGQIAATCGPGTHYQIGIGPSRNLPNDPSKRAMKRDDGNELIEYDLYQDSGHTQQWNTVWGSNTVKKGIGSGSPQNYSVYGQVLPNQKTPPPGHYSDAVIVELRVE